MLDFLAAPIVRAQDARLARTAKAIRDARRAELQLRQLGLRLSVKRRGR